jgi:outer membrane protein assembly factor BamB
MVIFGADDGRVYVLDAATGEEKWSYEIGAPVKASPAVVGGRILVGADDGVLYCFAPAE